MSRHVQYLRSSELNGQFQDRELTEVGLGDRGDHDGDTAILDANAAITRRG